MATGTCRSDIGMSFTAEICRLTSYKCTMIISSAVLKQSVFDFFLDFFQITYSDKELERFARRSNKGGASSLTNSMEGRAVTRDRAHLLVDQTSLSDGELLKDDGKRALVS